MIILGRETTIIRWSKKVHYRGKQGKTMCGLTIFDNKLGITYKEPDSYQLFEGNYEICGNCERIDRKGS